MKRYILFTVYCLVFTVLAAQGLSEQQIIEKMVSAAQQIKHMKMLSKEMVSGGKMSCQQPDKLRWEYTTPRPTTLILNGTEARLKKGDAANASQNKFIGEMARLIMNSVAGKCLADSKTFQVTAKESPTQYEATLLPLRKDIKRIYTKLVLHFDLSKATVTEVELYEKGGDRTVIELHDIQINKPINAEAFDLR